MWGRGVSCFARRGVGLVTRSLGEGIIPLRFITLQNCAYAQPAYSRPPFCGGSNPRPRVRIRIINHNKNHAHTGVIIYCGGDEGIPSHGTECRLRGNRDDLTALHWSNLLVVEPAICDCDGLVPFRSTGNNKMPRWGILLFLAETKGFEPLIPLRVYYISNVAH